jgi:hypothetical protein
MMPIEHEPIIQNDRDTVTGNDALGWAIFTCAGCGAASMAQGVYHSTGRGRSYYTNMFSPLSWYPTEPLTKTYPDSVPAEITSVAVEAYGCFGVKHYRAAILMARTVIEASAKFVGIDDFGITTKIKKMYEQGLIYKFVMEGAEELRQAGNEVAHGDLVLAADAEEAEALLNLMDRILDGLFIAPSEPAAQQARRQARQAATTAGTATTSTGVATE